LPGIEIGLSKLMTHLEEKHPLLSLGRFPAAFPDDLERAADLLGE
jgi:hypothetical protein